MDKFIGTFYGVDITFSNTNEKTIDYAEKKFKEVISVAFPPPKTDKEIEKEVDDFIGSCKKKNWFKKIFK